MHKWTLISKWMLAAGLMMASGLSLAYSSGSTGADGAFNPVANQSIQLPANGVFNYTSVNIPQGVTITYKRNAANTPVTILVSGNATIAGTIDVSAPTPSGLAINGGAGGPGGYDGGHGGQAGGDPSGWVNGYTGLNVGGAAPGPGGGSPAPIVGAIPWGAHGIGAGGGGAYATAAPTPGGYCPVYSGVVYGNTTLLPLLGGSGGGGGTGGSQLPGIGGAGGGGAILVAASGTLDVSGSILANGGVPFGAGALSGRGSQGGAGSGGAIRLIATSISGNGAITATGGSFLGELVPLSGYATCSNQSNTSQNGGLGRVRLEYETISRNALSTPVHVSSLPSLVFVPSMPALNITSIAGIAVPATPTGSSDVSIPAEMANPITVVFTTSGVTVGSTIKLTIVPAKGLPFAVNSTLTTGTIDSATAGASVSLPSGSNAMQATVTYTLVASLGNAMSIYAQGEQVEKVQLNATLGGASTATLITISGKEFIVPAAVLAKFQG